MRLKQSSRAACSNSHRKSSIQSILKSPDVKASGFFCASILYSASCPDLFRASRAANQDLCDIALDPRNKSGGDGGGAGSIEECNDRQVAGTEQSELE